VAVRAIVAESLLQQRFLDKMQWGGGGGGRTCHDAEVAMRFIFCGPCTCPSENE
jgi:hypothetical protein